MRILLLIIVCIVITSCNTIKSTSTVRSFESKARQLAHKYIIVDGHIDLPYRLKVINFRLTKEFLGIPVLSDEGDFDYYRAKQGGLDAPFMSIYIPSSYENHGARILADSLIDLVDGIAKAHPDKFAITRTPEEVYQNFDKGIISLPLGMENGAPIEGNLKNIGYFRNRGISYITLTHAKDNHICDSSYDTTRTWNGLSPFGKEVIREMNRTGIMIDVSHVSDSAFYQVLQITRLPVIASHSSSRKFTPGFERNMSDEMLVKLALNGGVIHINFGSSFLDGEVQKVNDTNRAALSKILADKGVDSRDGKAGRIIEKFKRNHPTLYSDVKKVADHIDHVVSVAGIDHVGLGSDFDGVGDSLPTGLKDVTGYPNLIAELLRRGYSESDIEKICYSNIFRVWKKVLQAAE